MNLFTKHPTLQEMTWGQHCWLALIVAIRLLLTAIIFFVHAVFPFIKIPEWLNLLDSATFLIKENDRRNG